VEEMKSAITRVRRQLSQYS